MNAINLLCSLNRSLSTKARTVFLTLNKSQKNFLKSKHTTSFGKKIDVNDVVLFKYEKPRLFILMNLGSAIQCVSWTYLGIFLFQSIKESEHDEKRKQFWSSVLEKDRKYSDFVSGVVLFFGWSVFFATCFYSLRSVREIILHRGGRSLTIVTYSLPGYNVVKVPLSCVSSKQPRARAKKFIPLKVKNKFFYYLVDVKGEFYNPELFDSTAGVHRNFS